MKPDASRRPILAGPRAIAVLALLALMPAAAHASIPGSWDLTMSGLLEGEEVPCVFEGTASMAPAAGEFAFAGLCQMALVSGPAGCPSSLAGTLGANVEVTGKGLAVSGQVEGGQELGLAGFSGLVVGDPTGSGTFAVATGPFAGMEGTWSGLLLTPAIPTLRTAALALLAALLAGASVLVLRRLA